MHAFAAALAVLTADPNISTEAEYRRAGRGPGVTLRLIRSAPDVIGQAFETSVIQPTDVLTIPVAALEAPQPGDTVTVGGEVLAVQHAERDAAGVSWRVACRRVRHG